MFPGQRKGLLHGFEGSRANIARFEIVNKIGAAPDVAVVENGDIAFGGDVAIQVIDRSLVQRDGGGLIAQGGAVMEIIGVAHLLGHALAVAPLNFP